MDVDLAPLFRIALAAALSLPIGLEREISGKAAGVRTHVLLGSATAALGWLSVTAAANDASADPTRIASYTVAGIGFLGAGLIVAVRGRVHGLTTAVAAFTVMAIGLLCGMGHSEVAAVLTGISLLTLGPIEWLKPRTYGRFVRSVATMNVVVSSARHIPAVQQAMEAADVEPQGVEYVRLNGDHVALHLTVRGHAGEIAAARDALHALDDVAALSMIAHASELAD